MTEPEWPALNVSGYVLAGGQSRRMGRDKALLEVDGEPLVARALRTLQPVCAPVRILSGPPDFDRDALLSCYAHLVHDQDTARAGPLAALVAALLDCPTEYVLLLAVDQPAISAPSLRELIQTGTRGDAAAACFVAGGRPEPLPLLASRSLRPILRAALTAGERRLLPAVAAAAAELGRELLPVEPKNVLATSFANLNTPEDLKEWQDATQSNQSSRGASETSNG